MHHEELNKICTLASRLNQSKLGTSKMVLEKWRWPVWYRYWSTEWWLFCNNMGAGTCPIRVHDYVQCDAYGRKTKSKQAVEFSWHARLLFCCLTFFLSAWKAKVARKGTGLQPDKIWICKVLRISYLYRNMKVPLQLILLHKL